MSGINRPVMLTEQGNIREQNGAPEGAGLIWIETKRAKSVSREVKACINFCPQAMQLLRIYVDSDEHEDPLWHAAFDLIAEWEKALG